MESQVQEVKNKIDIVQLVSGYVSLKKAGRNYKGLCPFHSEKTGSFMVSPERQIFKCFGCNEGGDALTFYQKIEGVEFVDALKALAAKAGVQIKEYKTNPNESQREEFVRINSLAAEFYHFLLTKHQSGKKALEYLKGRGLTEKTIVDWQIGFAPDSWDTTYKFLIKKKLNPKDISASGLAIPSTRQSLPAGGQGAYDRFRKRIMFPIRNISGTIVGFSGRIFGEGEPKYLNSPDNLLFNKSNNLFGLDKAKGEIKKENLAVLVEGNLDVIMSHQIGVANVICPLGTALTEKQLDLLRRFADQLVVSFDQDVSGQKAALRAVELAENQGLTLKLTELSEKDPDELIRKNPSAWKKALANSVPIYDFLINSLQNRYGTKDHSALRKITKEVLPYIARIDNDITRSHYERLLASNLGVSEDSIKTELSKLGTPETSVKLADTVKPLSSERLKLETYLLELIFQSGIIPEGVESEQFEVRQFCTLFELAKQSSRNKHFSVKEIEIPEELSEIFDRLTLVEIGEDILNSQAEMQKEIDTCTLRLKALNLRTELKKITLAIKQAEITKDSIQVENFTKKFQDYSNKLALLEKQKELI